MHEPNSRHYELALSLSLSAEGEEVEVLAGNIETFSSELHSYGFGCHVQFNGFENEKLDEMIQSAKITEAKIVCATVSPKAGSQTGLSSSLAKISSSIPLSSLFELKGIVTNKFYKRVDTTGGLGVAVQHYEIIFHDIAQVIWKEHFPINLCIGQSMKEIIEMHKHSDIMIDYDFPPLEEIHGMTSFCLEYQEDKSIEEQVSFYSFLQWYLKQTGGIWTYDYKENRYLISGAKKEVNDKPHEVTETAVLPPICRLPKEVRYNTKILTHSATHLQNTDIEEENAFESIRREKFDSESYQDFPENAKEKTHSSLHHTHPVLIVEVDQLEKDLHLDKLMPGALLKFQKMKAWTGDALFQAGSFRVEALVLELHKLSTSEEVKKPIEMYQLYAQLTLESKEETYISRPPGFSPVFPFFLQGTICSDIGEEKQSTYQLSQDEESSRISYLVSIPLAGEDKRVEIPFTPDFMSGQYYFPFCKGEKVLVALYFHTARIARVLDWQPLARLPTEVQGNQIVFSSDGEDQYAILKHELKEKTKPVITLKLASSPTQSQTVQIQDQEIVIVVEKKDQKSLSFCLNQEGGITVSLEDKDSGVIQKITLDGETLTSTCKNKSDTSTYVQTPDSLVVTCKSFTVNAETIALNAKDSINQKGDTEVNIETKIANVKASKVKLG